jgi:hypothetical protein
MPNYVMSEEQLSIIKERLLSENSDELISEAKWYNTVMDILGIVDPTPVVDIVNGISYFLQGDNLYGVLTMVGAIPYAGDVVAKPVLGALKIGKPSAKALDNALKLAKTNPQKAAKIIEDMAKEPGIIGKFLRSAGGSSGWANKVNKILQEIPVGPFKGMKNTIMDYFTLLGRAGEKSVRFQKNLKSLLSAPTSKNLQVSIPKLKDYLKTEKILDPASLTKPGMFSQVFFGGIPRLFRSPQARRTKIMMQQTKWWLGFLDYIGFGNWVGEKEVIEKLGSQEEMIKKMEEYQKTSDAKKYYEQSFPDINLQQKEPVVSQPVSQTQSKTQEDPFVKILRDLFIGKLNPIPGI